MRNLCTLREDMQLCYQTGTQSVLDHGYSVHAYYKDLRNHILHGTPLEYEWKLPEWVYDKLLWDMLCDEDTIATYQIYHDCGKPYCKSIDDQGNHHFHNHAEVSAEIWKEVGGSELVGELIKRDMDIHVLKACGIEQFAEFEHWPTLLITGLCELHSNAAMFGGIESTSFKIKWKATNKRGKGLMKNN